MSNREVIPEAQHMLDLNRSDRSEPFTDRELIEAIMHKDTNHLNESGGSRISAMAPHHSQHGNSGRPPSVASNHMSESGGSRLSTMAPHHSQNGNASRPASVVSKRSTNLSQERLSSIVSATFKNTDTERNTKKENMDLNIIGVAARELLCLCVATLVIAILSVELLLALAELVVNSKSVSEGSGSIPMSAGPGSLSTVSSSEYLVEVTTALLTFVVIWDVTCFLVFALQCIEIAAIVKKHTEEQRAVDYLNKCSSIQFIARTGFFVSIPCFLIAVILFVVLWFSTAAAVTAMVIVCIAAIFCSYSLFLTCSWRRGRGKLLSDIGTPRGQGYTSPIAGDGQQNGLAVSEMSTLV